MATVTETLTVDGIRCERCVGRLAAALRGHDGLEAANANLVGDVTLTWDDEVTSRDHLTGALSRAGFPEARSAQSESALADSDPAHGAELVGRE
jgi:copper chaperone CopZ